jgi:hypothetical protein
MPPRARPIDGAEGYRFYRRNGGQVELDEINEHLAAAGFRTVQPRMLLHYQKLERHGYESYITQNRLDLAVAGEDAWTEDMRARYSEVSQSAAGAVLLNAKWYEVTVISLGVASASVHASYVPPAGRTLVLRMQNSGIERVAVVTRVDRKAERYDLSFDANAGLPLAGEDAPGRLTLVVDQPPESDSVVAMTDFLLNLERVLTRLQPGSEQLPRLVSLSKASPLELVLAGSIGLGTVAAAMNQVMTVRKTYYEGTKAKYEAKSIQIDTEQKRRTVQEEADARLLKAAEVEEEETQTPVLDQLASEAMPIGAPSSTTRRQFLDNLGSMLALPIQLVASADTPARTGPN